MAIVLHFLREEARHELQTKEVEDYGELMKALKALAENTFQLYLFKMESQAENVELEDGDDLEAAMEELEGTEFHIKVVVSICVCPFSFPSI